MDINITDAEAAYKYLKNRGLNKLLRKVFNRETINHKVTASTDDNYELLACISDAKKEWSDANTRFEYADKQELVDYYTYKIKACQVRYEYFLKRAKEKGLTVHIENQ
jgi:hypothetical protein